MQELKGKVAVITGAGSGLGRELVMACARRGMAIAAGDVDEAGMADTERLLHSQLPQTMFWSQKLDVSKLQAVQTFADTVFDRFGSVHVLFNNAGVATRAPLWQNTENDWKWVLGVNLLGVAWGVKAFVPRMITQGEGHIVNTASAAGWVYVPSLGVYNVTKSGVVALSETLLGDLRIAGAQLGVTVVCPSFFRTGITNSRRNRPPELSDCHGDSEGASTTQSPYTQQEQARADRLFDASPVSATDVAELTLQAVMAGRLYVFPHGEIKNYILARATNATSDRNPPGL